MNRISRYYSSLNEFYSSASRLDSFYRCLTSRNKDTEFFDKLSANWWDVNGPFKALHSMNHIRVPWIIENTRKWKHQNRPKEKANEDNKDLATLNILDIGCGGGLLSLPLARLGANVTGIDLSQESVNLAEISLKNRFTDLDSSQVIFRQSSIKELYQNQPSTKFDIIIASEVVEHVDDLDEFFEYCGLLAKDHSQIFLTTINRNILSLLFAKYAAEYVLNVVPRGTHEWSKFIKPSELKSHLYKNGFDCITSDGLGYDFIRNTWYWSGYKPMNYAMHAVKLSSPKNHSTKD